jgi:anti-sigma B factor antagonist
VVPAQGGGGPDEAATRGYGDGDGYSDPVATGSIALTESRSGVKLLTVHGEHDLYTAPRLRQQLDALLDSRTNVIVDLTGATFVDSSILGALLNARQRAIEEGCGFAVCLQSGTEPSVRRIFEMTGLVATLPVLETVEEAEQAASAGPPEGPDRGNGQ